jgi:signal transduction histidine kinase/CheY-like chemotaxis protein
MPKKLPNLLNNSVMMLFFLLLFSHANAQFAITDSYIPSSTSIYKYAQIANAGQSDFAISDIVNGDADLDFKPVKEEILNIGFTTDHYWVRFEIENKTDNQIRYFLETARPVTDVVNLYTIYGTGAIRTQRNGDDLPFAQRSYGHRKPLFEISMEPRQKLRFYLELKSDGEVVNMPLLIRSPEGMFRTTLLEQIVFGIFYGILVIAAIIYLFFFFGIRIKSFLYYTCYVVFIGLMQFALDGYFYQYITPKSGWFSDHSVIIFACFSTYFLGKYAQEFLNIKQYSPLLNKLFNGLYICILPVYLLVFLKNPRIFAYAYPLANVLGLIVLILIISSVVTLYRKKGPIDLFFTMGVGCLILGFVIFILNNFNVLPNSFFTENSSKFGTGLEVIFLSLSMANYIRNINNERDEFNRLALVRSEEMNDLKSYFLSNISHELRTPLNAILNMVESVMKDTEDEKIKGNCQIIKYSSHSLLSSVNDILDFSKIEKGELQLEKVEFEPVKVLEHLKNNAVNRAKDQGLEFRFSKAENIPDFLSGDVTRLVQIVNNVLSNAIKFTPEGFVAFHIDALQKPNSRTSLVLTISDSGIGIPKEKLHGIFDSFSQNNIDNKRKFGGLGLGLYIVRTLIDMQKGSIVINSKVGEGTTCKITIDYDIIARQKEETALEAPVFDLKGKSILVVEDNAINQMVIKMITKKWLNTQVFYTNNGHEGVEAVRENKFDIILMDLQMPVMDGYEATIAIRNGDAGQHNKNIPIIAVTADVMETTKLRVSEIGMNRYLSKPIKNETLFRTISELLTD